MQVGSKYYESYPISKIIIYILGICSQAEVNSAEEISEENGPIIEYLLVHNIDSESSDLFAPNRKV